MFKNTAGQKVTVEAIDTATGQKKTGDSANITIYLKKDDGTLTVLGDTSATEISATNAKGRYSFDLTQAETDANKLEFSGKSSTGGIEIYPLPPVVFTRPPNFPLLGIDSGGLVSANTLKVNNSADAAASVQNAFDGNPGATFVLDQLTITDVTIVTLVVTDVADIPYGSVQGVTIVDEQMAVLGIFAVGTITSTTGTTTLLDTGALAIANQYLNSRLIITEGTGAGQERVITAYSSGRVATHEAWSTNPTGTSKYAIMAARTSAPAGSGGGGTLVITPLMASVTNPRLATRDLAPIPAGSAPAELWTITDANDVAINLSGKVVRFVAALITDEGDEDDIFDDVVAASHKYETGGSGVTVGGASSNQVTVQHSAANTATPGLYRYWLWNVTDSIVLARGKMPVEPAAKDYP